MPAIESLRFSLKEGSPGFCFAISASFLHFDSRLPCSEFDSLRFRFSVSIMVSNSSGLMSFNFCLRHIAIPRMVGFQ